MTETIAAWTDRPDTILSQALRYSRLPVCITDPSQADNPIVFANAAFTALTGYTHNEIVGRNCRFLQGPDTTPASLDKLRAILASGEVGTVEITNYRKDGSKFLNSLQIGPIVNEEGRITHFFGSQLDVTDARNREDSARDLADAETKHRLKNIVSVLSVLIRLTARETLGPDALIREIIERVQAVGDAHIRILTGSESGKSPIHEVIGGIIGAYAARGSASYDLDGPDIELTPDAVTPISLLLHELATNAVKYGALSTPGGAVDITWQTGDGMLTLNWAEKGGPPVEHSGRASGSDIVGRLVEGSGGKLEFDWRREGLRVRMDLPLA